MKPLFELLEEVQESAVDDSRCDMATLMRHSYLLAARLDNEAMKEWVNNESKGYPKEVQVPDYRVVPVTTKSDIPEITAAGGLDARQESVSLTPIGDSVIVIEGAVKQGGGLVMDLSGVMSALNNSPKYGGRMPEIKVWKEVSHITAKNILNAIRMRLLEFCTTIVEKSPEVKKAGETSSTTTAKAGDIFHTTIYNNSGTVAITGNSPNSVIAPEIAVRNYNVLADVLTQKGLSADDIAALRKVLDEEQNPVKGQFGPKLEEWADEIKRKVKDGTLSIAVDFVMAAIRKAIGL